MQKSESSSGLGMCGITDVCSLVSTLRQGITLVHFSAQRKRFLGDRGCI